MKHILKRAVLTALVLMTGLCFTGCPQKPKNTPAPKYEITFGVDGGNGTLEAEVDGKAINTGTKVQAGKTVIFTAAPKTGYKISGWTLGGKPFAEAGTNNTYTHTVKDKADIKVKFIPEGNYTITYHLNGGTDPGNPASYNVETPAITLKPAAKEAYTFMGWYDNDQYGGSPVTTIEKGSTGNKAFWAKWEVITYTITYHLNGGTDPGNPASYNVETPAITLKPAAKAGHTFMGWYDNGQYSGSPVTMIEKGSTGNKAFWAKWEVITYTITYHLNGGTDPGNPAGYNIETPAITLKPAAKEAHTFMGWYDNDQYGGSPVTTIEKGSTGNKAFWAKWEINKHKITFGVEGGNGTLKAEVDGKPINTGAKVQEGKTVKFTAKPDPGYMVEQWTKGGALIAEAGTGTTYNYKVTAEADIKVKFKEVPIGTAELTLSPYKKDIKVKVKTADGSSVTVGGCTQTTLTSGAETELHAHGTAVTLTGKITELKCSFNQLTALDVQGLTALQKLFCDGNKLPALNVQGCTALQRLECQFNPLTDLNVQGLTALQTLYCSDNKLTALDVQGLTALKELWCYCNKLNDAAFTKLFTDLPQREESDGARCILYTELSGEGNHTNFSTPSDLAEAFNNAKTVKNWKMYKKNAKWQDVAL